MKGRLAILILLIAMIASGAWLGGVLRPEKFQLRGKLTFDPAQVPSADYEVGDFIVKWRTENGGQLSIEAKDRPGFALWQTIPGEAFVMAAQGNETVRENRGMFKIEDQFFDVCQLQHISSIGRGSGINDLEIKGQIACQSGKVVHYSLELYSYNDELERLELNLAANSNRVFLSYRSTPDEHFFGFGEQFSYFDMKGHLVPIWVSEQGVGRGEQPLTFLADLTNGGAGGNAYTTYAPVPFFITNKMRSLFLVNEGYTSFDLRDPNRVLIEAFGGGILANLVRGESPDQIIQAYTTVTGRMRPLPGWIHSGAIVGMQGGTKRVREISAELLERKTPIAAFWLQDWVGQRQTSFGSQLWWNWEVDYDRYPNWDEMVSEFEKNEIHTIVYVSPYLADIAGLKPNMRRDLFQEAKENGYLVKNKNGEPYLVLNTDFYFGMVDLSNPEAWKWYKNVLKEQVINAGAWGWMADYGEGLPYDAMLENGTAPTAHNVYPVYWSSLNRQVVDESDEEFVFFNRAAYRSSPEFATLFWEGDQLVSWSEYDGIKSAVTGLNTAGLSGMAFNHSDIGGYTTISSPVKNYHRSRELLYRWMEMNAFTLIFRTHEGNQPENNVQFYTDDETLDTFAYWAKVYAALFDYRKQLVVEAVATGLPVVRHPFIHYPDDPETWKITYQEFMLGADFLIAPVTDPGADEVRVYLPAGRWVHLWTGTVYGSVERGEYVSLPAPIGQPGVFYKEASQVGADFVQRLQSEGLIP